ncbi:MAG: SPFH domain-containing protein [Acidobacteria bacterium]|nr:SPFH domain-containing protein [Acidobacteriota bacterium]MCL5286570.1 SPFH domain-containing protein [Acidobacteriota bacterium]
MLRERKARGFSGWGLLFTLVLAMFFFLAGLIASARAEAGWSALAWAIALAIDVFLLCGFIIVNPNEAKVIQLFGTYKGSLREMGFWWMNPLMSKRRISLRIRNFETPKLKINDHDGNPIEIAAVVVWKVVDSAEAAFEVDDYENFVHVQSESALRNMATSHPYDAHQEGQMSLRANTAEIALHLKAEIQERLSKAGVEVLESRISHLAYAPEIASAMLRRQQASAIVAARQKYVEGAVGMVEMALDMLSKKKIVELDEERKAAMVSNMLVVLRSDQHTQPVVNTGSLYH